MDELLWIKEELKKHYGKGNEMSAQIVENQFGNPADRSHAKSRELILKCAEKYHIPLGSNSNGYFIMTNDDELDEYGENLDSRIKGIKDRKETMKKYYEEWNK